jgi:hypothetical protein
MGMLEPAEALRYIHILIEGAADIANERQQRLLLECIAELARKGLDRRHFFEIVDSNDGPELQH